MRSLLLSALIASPFFASAQFFEIGLHGGGGPAMLINNHVSDQDDKLDYAASFGAVYGVHAGVYSRSGAGLSIELNHASVDQRYRGDLYTINITPDGSISKKVSGRFLTVENVRYWEVPVLFRKYHSSGSGFFFEIGPKFSFLDEAETRLEVTSYDANVYPFLPFTEEEDRYVTRGFRNVVVSGVLGLGGSWEVAPGLQFNTRLRLSYGFTDATEEYSNTQFAQLDPDKIGTATRYAHLKQDGTYGYEPTNIAAANLMLGFAYRFPFGGARRGAEAADGYDD